MSTKHPKLFLIGVALALILAAGGFPSRASAFSVTITVNTAADNTAADGLCSLREALANSNANAVIYSDCSTGFGSEIITFSNSLGTATIVLTSPLPNISDTAGLTILGGGKITVSGNDLYQVFVLNANVPLTLNSLTVAHGLSTSGGGAFVSAGSTLTILGSTFSNNKAVYPGNAAVGGGVDNHGTLMITNSTFSSNSAVDSGGGVINNAGTLTISNSTFSGNSSGYGGGLRSLGGTSSIANSSFSGNAATSFGGAIEHTSGALTISGSTFSTNTANLGGAIDNIANLTVANSTFFTNSAGFGGAISNSYIGSQIGDATILNSTFSGNSATFDSFGVVYNQAVLNLSNTIIANSAFLSGDCVSSVAVTGSNNLIEDATKACGLTNGVNGNILGTDPNLGPGTGSPVYLPLNGGSAAIDAGDDAKCGAAPVSNTSQNGRSRPNGAHCDIGAYEADVIPPTVSSIARANPNPSALASVTFTVTFSEPVYGVTVNDFVLTKTGILGGSVVSLSGSSGTVLTVAVTTGSGSGTIRLDLIDHNTILDTANLYLGGPGLGDGNFSAGEVYDIQRGAASATPTLTATATSIMTPTAAPTHGVNNTPVPTRTPTAYILNLPMIEH